jgi:ADP-ribose pyrophosphatase
VKLEWKKIKEEKYKAGWRKMLRKTFLLPNGKTADYDIKDEGISCSILALTSENKVVLEKTFRPGPDKVLLEMPAGFIDKNEKPENSAARELLEETGLKGTIELAGISTDDAYSNSLRYVFVVKNCLKITNPILEEDEIFEIVEMKIEDFRKHLRSGLITHAEAGYLALDYLKLI